MRIINGLEQQLGAGLLREEVARGLAYVALDDVVTEDDTHLTAVGELLGQLQRLGYSAFTVLIRVFEVLDPELLAVLEQFEEVAGVFAAGDDDDLVNASVKQTLDREIDHRPIVDRHQVLVGDQRQRLQSRAEPAGENNAFHVVAPPAIGQRRP